MANSMTHVNGIALRLLTRANRPERGTIGNKHTCQSLTPTIHTPIPLACVMDRTCACHRRLFNTHTYNIE